MRAGDSYKKWFTMDGLEEAFVSDVAGRLIVGKDRVTAEKFAKSLSDESRLILRKVGNCTYGFTNYRQILFTKGVSEPPREICVPTTRDALVLSALKRVLLDTIGEKVLTPKPQVLIGQIQNQLQSEKYDYFIKMDIKRFYHSISHTELMRVLWHSIHKPQVLNLIKAAITTPSSPMDSRSGSTRPSGLPEGLPISNMLANVYLSDLDGACQRDDEIAYYRYVDDILVFCKSTNANRVEKAINKHLKRLGLVEKSEKHTEGFICGAVFGYLGYIFDGNIVRVRKSSIHKIEHRIEGLIKQYARASSWRERERVKMELRLAITGCIWKESDDNRRKMGWVVYYSQATDRTCFAKLDRTIKVIDKRYGANIATKLPSFMRVYHEARYRLSTTSYIPTYGIDTPISKKREVLTLYGINNVDKRDDEWVNKAFTRKMHSVFRKMEQDVGGLS